MRWLFRQFLILAAMLGALAVPAHAACTGNTGTLSINLGTISQGSSSLAVGAVVKTVEGKWTSFTSNVTGSCNGPIVISLPMVGSPVSGVAGVTGVYATNLQGIGVRVSVWTQGQTTMGVGGGYYGTPTVATPLPYTLPTQSITGGGSYGAGYNYIRVEVIKTATTWQSGALAIAGPILTISTPDGSSQLTMMNLSVTGTLALRTCDVTTPNPVVTLNTVPTNLATRTQKSFSLQMTCVSSPAVSIMFEGQTVPGHPDMLQNRASTGDAKGVAIQILDSSQNVLTFGTDTSLTNAASDGQNTFNFNARYASVPGVLITPGMVNAIATFTMSYN